MASYPDASLSLAGFSSRLRENNTKFLRLKRDLERDFAAADCHRFLVLGWSSNCVGCESAQIQRVKLLQYIISNTTRYSTSHKKRIIGSLYPLWLAGTHTMPLSYKNSQNAFNFIHKYWGDKCCTFFTIFKRIAWELNTLQQ